MAIITITAIPALGQQLRKREGSLFANAVLHQQPLAVFIIINGSIRSRLEKIPAELLDKETNK